MVACLGLTKPMCKNVIDQACVGGGGLKNNLLWGVLPPFFFILFNFVFVLVCSLNSFLCFDACIL